MIVTHFEFVQKSASFRCTLDWLRLAVPYSSVENCWDAITITLHTAESVNLACILFVRAVAYWKPIAVQVNRQLLFGVYIRIYGIFLGFAALSWPIVFAVYSLWWLPPLAQFSLRVLALSSVHLNCAVHDWRRSLIITTRPVAQMTGIVCAFAEPLRI